MEGITDVHPTLPVLKASDATLRDYFAAKAMGGFIEYQKYWDEPTHQESCETVARYAYEMADAMLKEREKRR